MRITKKFAGSSAIGKQVFTPCDPNVDPNIIERVHVSNNYLKLILLFIINIYNI